MGNNKTKRPNLGDLGEIAIIWAEKFLEIYSEISESGDMIYPQNVINIKITQKQIESYLRIAEWQGKDITNLSQRYHQLKKSIDELMK